MPVRTQPLRHYPHNAIKIAVDFDGTVVTHDYPRVGKDIGAVSINLNYHNSSSLDEPQQFKKVIRTHYHSKTSPLL